MKEEGFKEVDKLPTPSEVFNIPEKPPITSLLFKVYGPAIIILGVGIGGGEFLTGPVAFVRWGMYIFYFSLITITLQFIYNIYCLHYTVATGEPVLVGLKRIHTVVPFIILAVMLTWIGFPGWIANTGTMAAWLQLGRLPTAADFWTVTYPWIVVLILLAFLIVAVGAKIERTLEIIQWILTIGMFILVILLALYLTPLSIWIETLHGFIGYNPNTGTLIGYFPSDVHWLTMAAYIVSPAFAMGLNLLIMGWYRDKGYGMSAKVGYIPALIGGKKITLSPEGMIAKPTPENISTFRKWIRITWGEHFWLFFIGNILGMLFPALIWRDVLPLGTTVAGFAGAAAVSQGVATAHGYTMALLITIVGFIILFTTFIGILDLFSRVWTDTIWSVSKSVRESRIIKNDVRRLYYLILVIYVIWALYATTLAAPLILIQISFSNLAIATVIAVPFVMYLIRKKLPKEYQPPKWMDIVNIIFIIYALWLAVFVIGFQLGLIK
jgi:Mn2+/Fe2+ NRAMP family transporter